MISARRADLYMILITLIWGATFTFIKVSLAYTNAAGFVAARFGIAALCMLPFVIKRFAHLNRFVLLSGIVLGLLNGFGYYGQTIGLKTISSADSAFITSTTVVIVPLLLPFFKLGKPHYSEFIAVIICLLGVYVLTGANIKNINLADGFTLVCAFTSALGILYLQVVSKHITDFILFAWLQIMAAGFVPLTAALVHHQMVFIWNYHLIVGLLYCALISTAITFFLQSRYQQYTSPTRVGLIFSLEPVFGTLFAAAFDAEPLTHSIIVGGGIILASLILADIKNWRFKSLNQSK